MEQKAAGNNMEVYVSVMRVDAALTTKEEADLKGRLSEARQEKIEKLRYAADRRLSLGAGLLLDQGLKRFGLRERTEAFGTVENGKPCLLHHPEIQFNLSHSGSMVMAAFASCPVGCDVEKKTESTHGCGKTFFCAGRAEGPLGGGNRGRTGYSVQPSVDLKGELSESGRSGYGYGA